MKNPWMSLWLSAANTAAAAGRGFWAAEAERQRRAFVKQMSEAMSPSPPGASPAKKRRAPARRRGR
jgi:hypothetical protein